MKPWYKLVKLEDPTNKSKKHARLRAVLGLILMCWLCANQSFKATKKSATDGGWREFVNTLSLIQEGAGGYFYVRLMCV